MNLDRRRVLELAATLALVGCAATPSARKARDDGSSIERYRPMQTRSLFTLRLTTGPTQQIGATPHGVRVTFPISGGTFEGERLRGKVLPGGDDWALLRADGVTELDLRVTLETDDGALVHMTFEGIRDDSAPGAPYFRTLPRFETAAKEYAFLNKLLAVGSGAVGPGGPVHTIEEIL